jgi:hypothetical protein
MIQQINPEFICIIGISLGFLSWVWYSINKLEQEEQRQLILDEAQQLEMV